MLVAASSMFCQTSWLTAGPALHCNVTAGPAVHCAQQQQLEDCAVLNLYRSTACTRFSKHVQWLFGHVDCGHC